MILSDKVKPAINRLQKPVSAAPLATFRVLFGLMMLAGTLRFWLSGWIDELYIKPKFYFSFMGFDWVHPSGGNGMYLIFGAMALATVMVVLGLFYRIAIITFFVTFTYIELLDVTNYLNHYYFISLTAFLLIWLPAGRVFSLDIRIKPTRKITAVPLWMVGVLRLQVGIVYFFAGLAKLNPDWLFQAIPMKIWLPAKSHLPLIGHLMYKEWMAYLFSWFGAVYDLFIVFFLINSKTRPWAYAAVLGFHICTAIFFPSIGMFPYVMIVCSTLFFSSAAHERLLGKFGENAAAPQGMHVDSRRYRPVAFMLFVFFITQTIVPLRFLAYPGHLFWTEEGYRFSWRVMLMEKSGNTFFFVKEPSTGKTYEVNNNEFLTPLQDKMMSTQPDLILRYAHYLAKVYAGRGIKSPAVYAECYVALNGARSRLFVDPAINLAAQPLSWGHYNWVLPYQSK